MLIDMFSDYFTDEDDEKLTEVMIHITNKAHQKGFRDALCYVQAHAKTEEQKLFLIGILNSMLDDLTKTEEVDNA